MLYIFFMSLRNFFKKLIFFNLKLLFILISSKIFTDHWVHQKSKNNIFIKQLNEIII